MVKGLKTALVGGLLSCCGALAAGSEVDLVVINGSVYTADAGQSEAQAFAVRGDIIEAVGSSEEILVLAGQGTQVLDLGGRRVLPGLHDAHIHPMGIVNYEGCNLESRTLELDELAAFVSECIERLKPAKGEWLAVRQWNFSEGNRPAEGVANIVAVSAINASMSDPAGSGSAE